MGLCRLSPLYIKVHIVNILKFVGHNGFNKFNCSVKTLQELLEIILHCFNFSLILELGRRAAERGIYMQYKGPGSDGKSYL